MSQTIPKVCAVQDLSCVGRCALTVVLPVLSAMGVQVVPLPTALFSTHSGGFGEAAALDCAPWIPQALRHFQACGITFDCIYSGYLGSPTQIAFVETLFSRPCRLRVLDPVMADHGAFYQSVSPAMAQGLRSLCKRADIITPNLTEAYFLLGRPYDPAPLSDQAAAALLRALSALGAPKVVVTGVPTKQGAVNLARDDWENACWKLPYLPRPASFPGTGDLFAAVLTGALLGGSALPAAVSRAAAFVSEAIGATLDAGTPTREGVLLEAVLPRLLCPVENDTQSAAFRIY